MVLDNWELDFENMFAIERMSNGSLRSWYLKKLGDQIFVGHYNTPGPGSWQYPLTPSKNNSIWDTDGYEKSQYMSKRFFDLYTDWLLEKALGLEEV